MSRFASKEIIPVHADDEPADIVYIHAQSTLGMERRINKRFLTMQGQAGATPTFSMDPTEYNFASLCEFIVRWEGPGFEGRKFSEAALAELDANDPLIAKVLRTIQQGNPRFADDATEGSGVGGTGASPNPSQPAESDGGASWQALETSGRENGTYISLLPSATAGTPE